MSIWDIDKNQKLTEKERKNNFLLIARQVDLFFVDKAHELGFEEREGQWEMSCDIVQSMIERKHILVEAGVGIGKTYAYIVPLLYYHKKSIKPKPVIIATSTIALQEQLANDLLMIEEIIDYHPDIIIAKGQTHFLCKDRLEKYFFCKKDKEEYKYYEIINKGGCQKSDWNIEIPDHIWNNINVSTFNPIVCRQRCLHKDYCFYYKLRKEMKVTNGFILCNQDLLAMNMIKRINCGNEIFNPGFEYIIIDEAHNLENKVRNSYTFQLTYSECQNIIENMRKKGKYITLALENKMDLCYKALDRVFDSLYLQILRQDKIAENHDKEIERYYVKNNIDGLKELVIILKNIYDTVFMGFGTEETYKNRGEDEALEKIENMYSFFESINDEKSNDIFWMNTGKKNKYGITIAKCPKNVNELTQRLLFSNDEFRVILTSATISSDGNLNYDYFISNTNLPIEQTLICDSKNSPFDYSKHAVLYYTECMPHPSKKRNEFIEAGISEIIRLLSITKGKALILFTAKRDMQEVYEQLHNRVPYKMLLQGSGASQNDIINEFKFDTNSVLLAVGSYWEGVSIEGKTLSNLIIFRLPFPVPEPIINYKISISENGLMDVLVPEMIIKLKQGIGRLIRNKNDYGIVSIIDPRLGENNKAPYKQLVWDALPIKNKTNNIIDVEKFYRNLEQEEHINV